MTEILAEQIIDDLLYVLDQGDEGNWSEVDWCNWAAATSPDRIVTLMKMAGVNSAAHTRAALFQSQSHPSTPTDTEKAAS